MVYAERLAHYRGRFLIGRFVCSRVNADEMQSMQKIVEHAGNGGRRSRQVLQELEWMDKQGQLSQEFSL